MPEHNFERVFFHCEMSAREVTACIVPEKKSKLLFFFFHLKCIKPKQKCKVYIAERQTLKHVKVFHRFAISSFDYLPCTCKKAYLK